MESNKERIGRVEELLRQHSLKLDVNDERIDAHAKEVRALKDKPPSVGE